MKNFKQYKKIILSDVRSKNFKFYEDGRIYYVYRVTNLIDNKHYYGSRISKQDNLIEDFWSYCTSGPRKEHIKNNNILYKVKIIKTFNDYNSAIIYESYLHKYFNVRYNDKFFNKSNQTPFDFLPDRRGMINCKLHDGTPVYIIIEKYKFIKSL